MNHLDFIRFYSLMGIAAAKEAAKTLGISEQTINTWVKKGK